MTIETIYAPETSGGNGVTTNFPIGFEYQHYSDIIVTSTVVATGATTTLVYGTDYTISPLTNSPANTGAVLLYAAPAAGVNITRARAVPITQETVWTPNDPNPSSAIQNAADKLTMIAQDLEYEVSNIQPSTNTAVVTTAVVSVPAISTSLPVQVNLTSSFAVGNLIQVSNATTTFVGRLTGKTSDTLTLTVLAITAGSVGDVLPVGSSVQLGSIAGATTVAVSDDFGTAATQVATINFGNDSPGTGIELFVGALSPGGAATIQARTNSDFTLANLAVPVPPGVDVIACLRAGASSWTSISAGSGFPGSVLQTADGVHYSMGFITAANVTPGSLTPALLMATNAPTDTFVPSYNLATGNFTWVNPGGGGLPPSGNAGQFLSGASGGTWAQWLDTSRGDGAFFFGNSLATNAYAGYITQDTLTPSGRNASFSFGIAKYNGTNWAGSTNGVYNFPSCAIAVRAAYSSIDTTIVETGQFGITSSNFISDIVRASGFRSGAGFWQYSYVIPTTSGAITLDFKNGAYQRQTVVGGAITYTLADSTPTPSDSSFHYANELTVEVNAPGAFVITWPGTVTWANGGSAPTLNAAGINIIRLIRRQGQTQWVGYVENFATSGYTDGQARSAVLSTTCFPTSATIGWTVSAGVSATPFIVGGSITGTYLAAGCLSSSAFFGANVVPATAIPGNSLPTTKLVLPGGSTVYMDGNGNFTAPASSGGGAVNLQNLGVAVAGGPFSTLNMGSNLVATNLGSNVARIDAAGGGGSGANNAPYNVKLSPYFAVGNGVADDTTAIQNAINAATTGGGGVVYFPAGTYTITSTLILATGVSLLGDGLPYRSPSGSLPSKVSTIKWTGAAAGVMASGTGELGGMYWRGLLFDGNSSAGKGWYFEVLTNSMFEHCQIVNCTTYGLHISVPNTNDCTGNIFSNIIISTPTATCLKIEARTGAHNACHNTFQNMSLSHGNNAIDINWSDNNSFYQTYCFKGAAAGTNYDVLLRGDSPVSGVGAASTRFYHLEGDVEAQSVTGAGTPVFNEVYGYDQSNGQRAPLIHTGAILSNFGISTVAETVTGHSNAPAIMLYQGQAICFKTPTAANTGTFLVDDGTHLRATRDGGNTWTNLV